MKLGDNYGKKVAEPFFEKNLDPTIKDRMVILPEKICFWYQNFFSKKKFYFFISKISPKAEWYCHFAWENPILGLTLANLGLV